MDLPCRALALRAGSDVDQQARCRAPHQRCGPGDPGAQHRPQQPAATARRSGGRPSQRPGLAAVRRRPRRELDEDDDDEPPKTRRWWWPPPARSRHRHRHRTRLSRCRRHRGGLRRTAGRRIGREAVAEAEGETTSETDELPWISRSRRDRRGRRQRRASKPSRTAPTTSTSTSTIPRAWKRRRTAICSWPTR